MAVTFTTAIGLTQNAFCSVTEADDYHAKRLFTTDWTGASTATKEAAIMWATRLLNELVIWDGSPTGDSTVQALQWPRGGVYDLFDVEFDEDAIPQFLKDATAEFARCLIAEELTKDNKVIVQDLKSMKVSSLGFDFGFPARHVVPESVMEIIKPWGKLRYQGSIGSAMVRA